MIGVDMFSADEDRVVAVALLTNKDPTTNTTTTKNMKSSWVAILNLANDWVSTLVTRSRYWQKQSLS